jgi:CubicO group peptidase (beta-lactamase class C family)
MKMLACFLLLCVAPMASSQPNSGKAARTDALFADFTGANAPGVSVMVIRDGKVLYEKSFGLASLEEKQRATSKTNYRLASVTKQFTATAILILAERKKLSLDDRLTDFFPDFPAHGREIRVRHLLNHTSGLLAYEDFIPPGTTKPVLDGDVLEILKRQDRTYFPPGTQFRYSNSGYALLALIVERVSGLTFAEFLKRNIFAPVGMRATRLNLQDALPDRNRAYGYSKRDGVWERTDQSLTSYVLGDGGVYSSAHDLRKWVRALDAARLIRRELLDEAMSATIPARPLGEDRSATGAEERLGYGYGWFVSRYREMDAVWHGGSTMGFRNHLLRIPEKKMTVIVLTNRNSADPAALARRVADVWLLDGR